MTEANAGLANWIGHLISDLPLWAVIIAIAIVTFAGVVWATWGTMPPWPRSSPSRSGGRKNKVRSASAAEAGSTDHMKGDDMKTTKDERPRQEQKQIRALTWTATEPAGPRRWWFFLLVGSLTPPVAVILLAIGNWSAALLAAVLGVLVFVVYLPRPKTWSYELNGFTLKAMREPRRGPADEKTIEVTKYRSVNLRTLKARKGHPPEMVLTLWPMKRLAADVDLYLPEDAEGADEVRDRVEAVISRNGGR